MTRAPGLYPGLDIDEYHADASAISFSGLKDMAVAPAYYYGKHLDPARPARTEPTPAMRIGTIVHCAILEQAQFDLRYAVGPQVTSKAAKEWKAFAAELSPGVEAITQDELKQARAMADSVQRIAPLRELLAQGEPEVSAFFIEPTTGARCRVRPDWTTPVGDGVILCDVKTTTDASPTGFSKSVANFKYFLQAALYTDGYERASGKKVHGFVFAVVEKDWPHLAAAYMLDDESMEQGRRTYKMLLTTYGECVRSGDWPGYTMGSDIQLINLPRWAKE